MNSTSRAQYAQITRRFVMVATACLIVLALTPHATLAKTTTWTNASPSDNLWSNPGNWDNGVPVIDDDVLFAAVGGLSVMDIIGLGLMNMDMTGFTGTLDLAQFLSVVGSVVTSGTFDMSSGDIAVGGDLTVLGDMDATSGTISTGGGLYTAASFTAPDAAMMIGGNTTFDDGADVTFANIQAMQDMTVSGSLLADGATITVAASFDGSGGATLDMGSAALQVAGDLSVGGASMTWSGGTLLLGGNWTAGPLSSNYASVQVSPGGGTVALSAPGMNVHMTDLSVSGGTLELSSGDLTVDGNTVISPTGTLENSTNAGATLQFNGGVTVNGSLSSTAGGCTLRFVAGAPGTVDVNGSGTFEVNGLPGNRTRLEQDGVYGGSQWILDHEPTVALIFDEVEVQDSYAQPGPVMPANSKDLGNNTNWDFGPKTTTWTGLGGTGIWSDFLNWDNGVPSTYDEVLFGPVGGFSVMDIPGLLIGEMDMTGYAGTLELGSSLDVLSHVTTSGTLDMTAGSLTVGGDLTTNGTFSAVGGNVSVGGSLHVNDILDLDAGVLDVRGPIDGGPGATLNIGNGTLTVRADVDLTNFAGVNFGLSGQLQGRASSDYEIDFAGSVELANVWVYHSSPTVKLTLSSPGSVTVNGDVDVERGIVDLDLNDVTIKGDTFLRVDGEIRGTYRPNYLVDFEGHIEVVGKFEFKFGKIDATLKSGGFVAGTFHVESAGSVLRFADSQTFTVQPGGTMTVIGGNSTDRAKLLLDGAPNSGRWLLDVQSGATTQFENIEVQDSDASPGETCTASGECIDLGNNDNWNFVGTAVGDTPPPHLSMRAVPNPFNPSTTLHYGVPNAGKVTIRIYDVRGALVRTLLSAAREQGAYTETWDGRDDFGNEVATGVYLCRLEASGESLLLKLVLLK